MSVTGTPVGHIRCYGTFLRETDKAVYFRIQSVGYRDMSEEEQELWVPKSQVIRSFLKSPNVGEDWMEIAEWILQKTTWY